MPYRYIWCGFAGSFGVVLVVILWSKKNGLDHALTTRKTAWIKDVVMWSVWSHKHIYTYVCMGVLLSLNFWCFGLFQKNADHIDLLTTFDGNPHG